jgi:hypothetical protein
VFLFGDFQSVSAIGQIECRPFHLGQSAGESFLKNVVTSVRKYADVWGAESAQQTHWKRTTKLGSDTGNPDRGTPELPVCVQGDIGR